MFLPLNRQSLASKLVSFARCPPPAPRKNPATTPTALPFPDLHDTISYNWHSSTLIILKLSYLFSFGLYDSLYLLSKAASLCVCLLQVEVFGSQEHFLYAAASIPFTPGFNYHLNEHQNKIYISNYSLAIYTQIQVQRWTHQFGISQR